MTSAQLQAAQHQLQTSSQGTLKFSFHGANVPVPDAERGGKLNKLSL